MIAVWRRQLQAKFRLQPFYDAIQFDNESKYLFFFHRHLNSNPTHSLYFILTLLVSFFVFFIFHEESQRKVDRKPFSSDIKLIFKHAEAELSETIGLVASYLREFAVVRVWMSPRRGIVCDVGPTEQTNTKQNQIRVKKRMHLSLTVCAFKKCNH